MKNKSPFENTSKKKRLDEVTVLITDSDIVFVNGSKDDFLGRLQMKISKINEKFKLRKANKINNKDLLNSKILEITLQIKDAHPELSKYIEELPITIPTTGNKNITTKNLASYYESLCSILIKYLLEHAKNKD